jgi:hypothetical protein
MGECGCSSMDERYKFEGPNRSFYILTLSGACQYCDSPPGICIEKIEPNNILYKEYCKGEFLDGDLIFEKWSDSQGVAIITGMLKHEFIKSTLSHLIGVDSKEMGENGIIDEFGADVICEEMYADTLVKPRIVK